MTRLEYSPVERDCVFSFFKYHEGQRSGPVDAPLKLKVFIGIGIFVLDMVFRFCWGQAYCLIVGKADCQTISTDPGALSGTAAP